MFMSAKFLYKRHQTPQEPPGIVPDELAAELISESRACCCPARPVVRIIMPPSARRPHPTDLLLCGHHYRVSRKALAAAHAIVCGLGGMPSDTPGALLPELTAPSGGEGPRT